MPSSVCCLSASRVSPPDTSLVLPPQGREWFYDEREQTLIYKPNGTVTPTGEFVATSLKVLFNVSGTKQEPAHHIAITGVTLRDTAYTYFDPHGLPSGGDWALQKQGAITVVGSEAVTIVMAPCFCSAQSPPLGSPCGSKYVYAVSRRVTPVIAMW